MIIVKLCTFYLLNAPHYLKKCITLHIGNTLVVLNQSRSLDANFFLSWLSSRTGNNYCLSLQNFWPTIRLDQELTKEIPFHLLQDLLDPSSRFGFLAQEKHPCISSTAFVQSSSFCCCCCCYYCYCYCYCCLFARQ